MNQMVKDKDNNDSSNSFMCFLSRLQIETIKNFSQMASFFQIAISVTQMLCLGVIQESWQSRIKPLSLETKGTVKLKTTGKI